MNTYSAHHGFGFQTLRAALHLPRQPLRRAHPVVAAPGDAWLERLAQWAERQPMHHRMGSYMQRR